MSVNALIASFTLLQDPDKVTGVLLFKGQNVIFCQTPFPKDRNTQLRALLDQMLSGYQQVGRRIRQICLEFDGGYLLILVYAECTLCLLLKPWADPDIFVTTAGTLLHEHSSLLENLPNTGIVTAKASQLVATWTQARKIIEMVLGKVMGSAQMDNLINRTLSETQTTDPFRLTPLQVRQIATAVIEQIPNTSKRKLLLAELDARLSDINL